jgi:adenylate cyclase
LRYLFEDFVLDTGTRELRRDDAPVPVEPKVFDVLAYLIENRARVVSKDELIAEVWRGRIVSDSTLFTRINLARSAVGDSGEAQRLIKTATRKGLRFVGSVREEQGAGGSTAGAFGADKAAPLPATPDRPSIAVLPLSNLGGDKAEEYFSDGITEDIITELSRFSDLLVIARNSSFQYKDRAIDVRQIGRELGVRYVLEGSIRRSSGRIRISVQLIDATTGTHRWAERYDRDIEDVFAVQDEVARTIAAILVAHVNRAEIERTLNKPPASWQAYDCYLRAADLYASYWSSLNRADLYEMRRMLEKCLAIDPKYARACASLGWTYLSAWHQPLDNDHLNPAALHRAHQLACRAVRLDPNQVEAQAGLAHVLSRMREYDAALDVLDRAMALNRNFTDWRFVEVLLMAGSPERAIAAAERHMQVDPLYVSVAAGFLALAHYTLNKYSRALPWAREHATRAPNMRLGHMALAVVNAQLGNLDEARAAAAGLLHCYPNWTNLGTGARLYAFRRPLDAAHFLEGLRKAGLPDK